MSKASKTLTRILQGNADADIRFGDVVTVLRRLGFAERVRGDHHIFTRDGVVEILNLQPRGGKAKAYQVKQLRQIITDYELATEAGTGEPPAPEDNPNAPPEDADA